MVEIKAAVVHFLPFLLLGILPGILVGLFLHNRLIKRLAKKKGGKP